jgi:glycosyltransferase 2 family protein
MSVLTATGASDGARPSGPAREGAPAERRAPRAAAVLRLLCGALVLGVLVWRLGTTPVVHGVRTLDAWSLAAAAFLALATTVCAAWRWRLVATALDVPIGLRAAVAACYRAQFLNVTLPGGVLGDVHRGVRHGRGGGKVGRSLRAVAWERTAGQVVQLALAVVVLLALPSPLDGRLRALAAAVLVVVVAATVLASRRVPDSAPTPGPWRWARVLHADLHALVPTRSAARSLRSLRPAVLVVVLSSAVVAGHVATFALAAHATGAELTVAEVVPVALVVLVASGLPLNVAGWGPREGVAAWVFASAGWGAAQGLATAVAYGVMVFVASLPGAAVLAREGVSRG